MEIIWHGYACFELISGGYSLLLDPFRGGTLAGFPSSGSRPTRRFAATDTTGTGPFRR